jgi:starch synthase
MRTLLASSEVHPFSKTGGLADMAGALAKAIARAGHHVGLVTPLYAGIRERLPGLQRLDWDLNLPLGRRQVRGEVWTFEVNDRLTVYFVDQPEFYDRPGLYDEHGAAYGDNAQRFIFLSKAVANLARYLPWRPQMVHMHDWQTGFVPLLILHQRLHDGWTNAPRTCLTIHNLAYQGNFPAGDYQLGNLPWDYFYPGVEFYGTMSCLKAGIVYADTITTVSPRYAREITTEEYGFGMDGLLRQRQNVLFGILNGVDYEEWTTVDNPFLPQAYSADNLDGKTANKQALQAQLGLPVSAETPVFGNITRLVDQKGVDIQIGALEEMLAAGLQFVILGTGSPAFEAAYENLARRYPDQVAVRIGYNQALSHLIEAGSDFYLMPSRFEPCGLNQMYSLRYGTIPIVRRTGGLDDSVIDVIDDPDHANGIKFSEFSVRALAKAIRKALELYRQPSLLRQFRKRGMTRDFSWDRTWQEYAKVYSRAGLTNNNQP